MLVVALLAAEHGVGVAERPSANLLPYFQAAPGSKLWGEIWGPTVIVRPTMKTFLLLATALTLVLAQDSASCRAAL